MRGKRNGIPDTIFIVSWSLKYSVDRKAFGQPISAFQAIRYKLTRMATEIEAARLLILRAAWLQDNGMEFRKEAAMAKLYSSEVCQEVAREAIQIHGGYGCMEEFPVTRYLRDSFVLGPSAGTSDIMKVIVARWALS
jgi:alkylation response protein AidB-like acyl-CoA dehydrogenase